MKFLQFMEAKFTEHSLSQTNNAFSIIRDGEQKATQTYMWFFRLLAKYWAIIKLPLHFLTCKLGLAAFPECAYNQVSEFTELRKKQADDAKQKMLEEAQAANPGKVVGIDKSVEVKPLAKS